ncbi:hypothetical protein AAVH_40741, partial [Aphelenchoides avenae]
LKQHGITDYHARRNEVREQLMAGLQPTKPQSDEVVAPATVARKPGPPKRSFMWAYAEQIGNDVFCLLCDREFRALKNHANIKDHLQRAHKLTNEVHEEQPDAILEL